MVIFLTSSFVKYQTVDEYVPHPIDESNSFSDNLQKYWKENSRFLIFISDPSDNKLTEHITKETKDAFSLSDFST